VRFKLDENLPTEGAILLADLGHDAMTVIDQSLAGETDKRLINICTKEERVLVTLDLDFADIRNYPPRKYSGIIVLRPRTQSKQNVLLMLRSIAPLVDSEVLKERLWIVDEEKLRIRGES
jgi:predicted nuclease of predicted toxin-antitoxin system